MSLALQQLFGVQGKVVIVTGGGRGIGKMIADGFVQNGATVYIASRDLDVCTATATELSATGPGKCVALQCDLSTEAACKALAAEIAKRETHVDVLINNSGAAMGGDFDVHDEAAWDFQLAINVKAPYFLTVALLPLLDAVADGSARVINVGSIAGLRTQYLPTMSYDTSKAALHHLTRVLATKLARRPNGGHILVNTIAPGHVPSVMSDGVTMALQTTVEAIADGYIPTQRVGGPQDMAGLAIFLASKAAAWITGEIIVADGGQLFATETVMGPSKYS